MTLSLPLRPDSCGKGMGILRGSRFKSQLGQNLPIKKKKKNMTLPLPKKRGLSHQTRPKKKSLNPFLTPFQPPNFELTLNQHLPPCMI